MPELLLPPTIWRLLIPAPKPRSPRLLLTGGGRRGSPPLTGAANIVSQGARESTGRASQRPAHVDSPLQVGVAQIGAQIGLPADNDGIPAPCRYSCGKGQRAAPRLSRGPAPSPDGGAFPAGRNRPALSPRRRAAHRRHLRGLGCPRRRYAALRATSRDFSARRRAFPADRRRRPRRWALWAARCRPQ